MVRLVRMTDETKDWDYRLPYWHNIPIAANHAIEPALTAEEWEYRKAWRDDMGPYQLAGTVEDDHAIAALLLHGQPFGFTWADVDLIRRRLEYLDDMDRPPGQWSNLADRIEALLPPRE